MEFCEAVKILDSGHESDKCPFCPIVTKPPSPAPVAKIGRDNNSNTLGSNLEGNDPPDPKSDHLYEDSEHGQYSAEAHHIICGNEILGDEKEVEKYLITQNKMTTKKKPGKIENTLHDVDWDVNAARNGIWLPSVPDMYRIVEIGKEPEVWWGKQTKKSGRKFLSKSEKKHISFLVMSNVKRQFHKGSHKSAALPDDSYVLYGINELKKVKVFLKYYSKECPMEDGTKTKRDKEPFRPPHGIAHIMDLLSDHLKRELVGEPTSWNYFISEYAMECKVWAKT